MFCVTTYLLFQRPGGTYALYCNVTRKDGIWELKQPFAVSESFKPEAEWITPFHLLHTDVRAGIHSCVATLNEETNGQPHLIKWAFKEAYRIRDHYCYGFIVECLVTKRSVLQYGARAELFKPTPMMLVSIKILPDEFRILSKLPLSNDSQTSGSISSWTKLPFQYMTAAGIVTAVINNNNLDLTKHPWGLKGLILSTDHLYAVMEWQHAELVHIPSQASVPSAAPPVTQPPPYTPQS